MATTEKQRETAQAKRTATYVVIALLVIAAIAFVYLRQSRPPQMGVDDQVFHTVDALYTAVRNRDEARVSECAERLHSYRDAGTLPKDAAKYLDNVVAKARSGDWETATRRLYDFMLAQRREKF
jgi:hypothetical protein